MRLSFSECRARLAFQTNHTRHHHAVPSPPRHPRPGTPPRVHRRDRRADAEHRRDRERRPGHVLDARRRARGRGSRRHPLGRRSVHGLCADQRRLRRARPRVLSRGGEQGRAPERAPLPRPRGPSPLHGFRRRRHGRDGPRRFGHRAARPGHDQRRECDERGRPRDQRSRSRHRQGPRASGRGADARAFGLLAETVQGASVTVHLDPLMINDANVTSTDVLATNGVIHVIDKVLVPPPTQSIVEIASADPYWFSTLVTLLEAADLVETLSGDGPFTVFAPSNDAFAELDLEYYLAAENKAELESVLLYHVLAGQVLSTDLTDGLMPETVQGATVTAHLNPLMINDANLNRIDGLATNGVIHRINKVLVPPELTRATLAPSIAGPTQSIVEIASADPDTFSTLVAALEAADLVETLSGDGPFTVFAPSNDAFAELDLEYFLAAENKAELQSVLL